MFEPIIHLDSLCLHQQQIVDRPNYKDFVSWTKSNVTVGKKLVRALVRSVLVSFWSYRYAIRLCLYIKLG